ncbi:hypothetical protein WMY93_001617 [Mugilogobius chulae]|uniref:DUF3967 domain-containing protein n=1 Tax=Mugilogobius chulae TaxID=88201 RepID=A0AAW0PR84_9GOBI
MDRAGTCTVCPGKCHWSSHFNQPYRWDYVPVKEKQTLREMKEKYAQAKDEKLTVEQLIERQEEEIESLQEVIMSLIDQSAHSLSRLSEIALRPNPLTAPDYIHMMIEGEKSEQKPGYNDRIQALEAMRDKAKIISQVSKKNKVRKLDEESKEQMKPEKKQWFWAKWFKN